MRMFRFSSWISESRGAEDLAHGGEEHLMAEAKPEPPRPLAVQAVGGGAKRKRDNDRDAPAVHQDQDQGARRRKIGEMGSSLSTGRHGEQEEDKSQQPTGAANTMETPGISMPYNLPGIMYDTIESQLGLEILLRHAELRIVNQNLAKAQVALEQLRRCHLIPFPITEGTTEAKLHISAGTGPAVTTRQGAARPQWAAPYGVTDGPYSRHYAKWLIPDLEFDGELDSELEKAHASRIISEGRSTRNSTDILTPGAKARIQRGFLGQKLQALPSGYTPSKENAGPSVLKRPDGQLVKLVCLDCKRENFGSTQGFINHCRIAHKREFKSHEEAAVQSGVPVEVDDVGGIVGEEKAPPVATGLVHPLILSAPTDRAAYVAVLSRINRSMNMYNQGKLPGVTSIPGQESALQSRRSTNKNANFVPASETPNLSRFLESKGFAGKLNEIVAEAKKKTDLDDYSEDSDTDMNPVSQLPAGLHGSPVTPMPAMRIPARAPMSSLGRPGSSKGPESRNSRMPNFLEIEEDTAESSTTHGSTAQEGPQWVCNICLKTYASKQTLHEHKTRRANACRPSNSETIAHMSGITPRLPYATPINTAAAINHNRPNARVVSTEDDRNSDDEGDSDMPMLDAPTIHDLSPNTITSNNAPSLVSDDDEYDEGDDDAESSVDGSEEEEEGSDVAEINFEDADGEDKVLPGTALRRRGALQKENKHVTFVSPVKECRTKSRT